MKATVKKINSVRGFMPTTYAVYFGEKVLKICLDKKEADKFAESYNKN